MAPHGSTHPIPAYHSRMKGWVGPVGWTVADGLPTAVVTHQLQVERRTGKVWRPVTDVLPLCYPTNRTILNCGKWVAVWPVTKLLWAFITITIIIIIIILITINIYYLAYLVQYQWAYTKKKAYHERSLAESSRRQRCFLRQRCPAATAVCPTEWTRRRRRRPSDLWTLSSLCRHRAPSGSANNQYTSQSQH